MRHDFDPKTIDTAASRFQEIKIVNRLLESIHFGGKCIGIGIVIVRHPTATKKAQATVDGALPLAFRLSGSMPLLDGEPRRAREELIQAHCARLSNLLASAAQRAAQSVYDESFRMPDHLETRYLRWFNREDTSSWDWLIRKTFEDVVRNEIPEIAQIITSQPIQNGRGTRSYFMYAVLDSLVKPVLDRDFATAQEAKAGYWTSQSLEEATVNYLLSHLLIDCVSRGQRLDVPENIASHTALGLLEFHVASVCSFGYSSEVKGIKTKSKYAPPLFEWCNRISQQLHEGKPLKGRLYLSAKEKFGQTQFRLRRAVNYSNERAIGKLIAAASEGCYPILTNDRVGRFGHYDESDLDVGESTDDELLVNGSIIEFRGFGSYTWKYREQTVLEVVNGLPRVPTMRVIDQAFAREFNRCFPEGDLKKISGMVEELSNAGKGAMLIVADSAASEIRRIDLGIFVVPILPTRTQLKSLAGIDGGVLVDAKGFMFAFGFLIDGATVNGDGDIARGSRYNSAVRYVMSYYSRAKSKVGLMVVVISDDGMIDFVSPSSVLERRPR